MTENKARTIKLFCPLAAKTASMVAREEEKLDLGAIAITFGVDPQTMKLNGHYIGRGADFIAASVTWKSLLSFFTAKGLPTGENDSKPIVVNGKLSKAGTKRSTAMEDANLIKCKKMRTCSNGFCSKRKQLLEDVNLLKKLKISEGTNNHLDIQGRSKGQCSSSSSSSQLRCSFMRGSSMKRMREDEGVVAAPFKKIR